VNSDKYTVKNDDQVVTALYAILKGGVLMNKNL